MNFFTAITLCWRPGSVLEPEGVKTTNKQTRICSCGFLLAKGRKQQHAVKTENSLLLFYFPFCCFFPPHIGLIFRWISTLIWLDTMLRNVCVLHCLILRAHKFISNHSTAINTPKIPCGDKKLRHLCCKWDEPAVLGLPEILIQLRSKPGQNISKMGQGIVKPEIQIHSLEPEFQACRS